MECLHYNSRRKATSSSFYGSACALARDQCCKSPGDIREPYVAKRRQCRQRRQRTSQRRQCRQWRRMSPGHFCIGFPKGNVWRHTLLYVATNVANVANVSKGRECLQCLQETYRMSPGDFQPCLPEATSRLMLLPELPEATSWLMLLPELPEADRKSVV